MVLPLTPDHAGAEMWLKGSQLSSAWKRALHVASSHTGLPRLLIAAIVVVVGVRWAFRSGRLLVEVGIVFVLVAIAARLGWISW